MMMKTEIHMTMVPMAIGMKKKMMIAGGGEESSAKAGRRRKEDIKTNKTAKEKIIIME